MTDIQALEVESLSCFMDLVSKRSNEWRNYWYEEERKRSDRTWPAAWLPWFRGEDSAKWWSSGTALQPRLYRDKSDPRQTLDLEAEMRVDFRRRAGQLITERAPDGEWERYFLMQHHGAPTRLLDWSDAALVGLYFAVSRRGRNGDKNVDADAAVYMLDPWWLNEQAFKQLGHLADNHRSRGPALPDWEEASCYLSEDALFNEELEPNCPLAIDPPHLLRRFAAQRSCFTIFGREKDGLRTIARSQNAHLVKLDVKKECVSQIQQELQLAGISESTIFPDLEGLGRQLSYWFHDKSLEVEAANKLSTGGD